MLQIAWNHPGRTGGPPKVIIGDSIKFDNVDIFSPAGELLAKGLTFEVKKNTNVLVSGRNGCGKSSLFRIVGKSSFFSKYIWIVKIILVSSIQLQYET